MNWRFLKISISVVLLLLIVTLSFAHVPDNSTTYSIVHLSDTQNLASAYPETYDYTFSYLDSIKERYNISAIIITGDLVNTWDNKKEWEVYSHAIHETSIPIYVIAGNHDTNQGDDYQYYTQYTGNTKNTYMISLEDFDLVGINSVFGSLKDVATLQKTLLNSSKKFTIIATHYYMDEKGTLSPLGNAISQQLIVKPTIILAGHKHGAFVRERMIGPYPVIEDLTDYQDGIPGGSSSNNVSAGTFYTVTTSKGLVEKISSKVIWISPRQSFDTEQVVYDRSMMEYGAELSPAPGTPDCSIFGECGILAGARPDGYWNSFLEFFKGLFRFS